MAIFHLKFPKFQKNFGSGNLTFSIGNIKSRAISVGYIVCHCYDYEDDEILVNNKPFYIGEKFLITSTYVDKVFTFDITDVLAETNMIQIELVLRGITSENPVWFNQVMLENSATHEGYHKPAEAYDESNILFNYSNYAVLYNNTNHSLQVIRPKFDNITTKKLLKSKYTVLAPHLDSEPITDTPQKLMMEFINQTEQSIQIKKG